jgi:NADH dehydrogenase
VVNLVGILSEGGRQRFDAVQGAGAGIVAAAARAAGITRMVQLSAIGADAQSASAYARSKAAGEAAVVATLPQAVILRPSVVFGPDDAFFNRFAAMAELAPMLPLIGGGGTRLQPVYAGDVAAAVVAALDGAAKAGTVYELGGPDVMTLRDCLETVMTITGRRRPLVSVPFSVAGLLGALLQVLPNPPLTPDQVTLLKRDNIVSAPAVAEGRTLAAFVPTPTTVATVLPTYLWRFRLHGQFGHADGKPA